jgi:23S rRNA (guanosine2251-2'-O)-methyltransferase
MAGMTAPNAIHKLNRVEIIYGIHAVTEALRSRPQSISHIAIARGRSDAKLQKIIEAARSAGVALRFEPRQALDRLSSGGTHQGVIASISAKAYGDVSDIISQRRGKFAFVLVLDGIEDPHNLGAIIRTADAAGADGIIIPERRATGVTGIVAKASAGAVEHLPIARVTNISRALEELKSKNIWTVGLDERGSQPYDQLDYKMDCALVLGAEGKGLHEHVRKHCDFVVSIPMLGKVPSLNVSVAAAVVMYELVRQRRTTS